MESIIIYGGSFDPIHNGHLRIAHAASMMLNANVVFVPSKAPRWKNPEASAKQRLEMLRLALKQDGSPAFSIDLFEINSKSEVNYSIDLVRHVALTHKNTKIYLMIGADEVNSFPNWKDPDKICELATPLFVSRPDIEIDDAVLARFPMQRLAYDGSGPVSSSAVRSLRSIDIPLAVRDYIESNQLYYVKKLSSMMSQHRLLHSMSVANLAYLIAQHNNVENYPAAYIAGLLHDCGKDVEKDVSDKIMKENFPDYLDMPRWSHHQFVGAYLAENLFGVHDSMVLEAIRFHSTGKAHMSPLGKIIYAVDKIEPTRGFDSRKLIHACYKHYYVGFMNVLEANRDYLESKGYTLDNPLTEECFNQYLGRID